MGKFCTNCGKELESGANNCGNCGAPVVNETNVKTEEISNGKERYNAGFTVGLLSIPCGLLIAISGWILGIVGIVINNNNKDKYDTKLGLILSIVGLALAVLNSVIAVVINFDEIISAFIL